jgi:hypothetical protein
MRSRVINMLESCRSIDEFERLNRIDEGAYGTRRDLAGELFLTPICFL